ncbi:hypothetical protein HQ585_13845 [candidate division KSB1 bacterium]|nr:hypothetical protein [candidate division KSB1 bacterium]
MVNKLTKSVIILLFLYQIVFAQSTTAKKNILLKTHETAGLCFQLQSMSPESGSSKSYKMLAIPIQAKYNHNRYVAYTLRYNMGHQSFDGNGLFSFGNLNLGVRVLSGEKMTYMGELILPTGSQEFERNDLNTTSAGRLPFINAPLIYRASGMGLKLGASYGTQINEHTTVAFGARYSVRGSYTPIKKGTKYNPSDELMIAAGIDYGDAESLGFMGDLQISLYSDEKVNHETYSDPGIGFSLSGDFYFSHLKINSLFYKRGESDLSYAGEFKPPSILRLKLSHKDVWDYIPLNLSVPVMPYIGYMMTGEGTMVDGSNLILLGATFGGVTYNEFPLSPYLEIGFGKIGDETSTFGLKIGTDVAFQVY